jgi:transcriptional regulator with XRE-family HTH domain
MKLTQKQLASLAKVSTPTVSRFENAEKDLRLSSVVSLLDVLGMSDKRTLTFPDEERHCEAAHGAVAFWGQDGTQRVLCRISREALDDHFSEGDRLRPEATFDKHRQRIEALARRKYLCGRHESDGSVLIRTGDVS